MPELQIIGPAPLEESGLQIIGPAPETQAAPAPVAPPRPAGPPGIPAPVNPPLVETSPVKDALERFIVEPTEYWGRNLWRGVLGSQAGAYDFAGNLAELANKATEALGGEVAFPDLPKAAHEYAQRIVDYAPKLEEVDEHFVGRVLEGLGAAPQAIAEYATASKALRSGTAGFAALDAAREANKGWKEALLAGVKGALLGKAFEGTAGLARTAKVPALGVLGGTMAATEGGDVKDIAVGATTLGALGAMHRGPVGVRQAGRRFVESFKKPPEIPIVARETKPELTPEPGLPAAPTEALIPPEVPKAPVEAPAAPKQAKPPWEMSLDEIDIALERESGGEKADAIAVFGPEAAQRYERLQRRANSVSDLKAADKASAEIGEMEAGLTPEQEARLFGIGERGPSAEELADYRRALSDLDTDSAQALGRSLGYAVTRVGGKTDPAEMNYQERLAFAQVRRGMEIAQERGFDTAEVSQAAIKTAAARFPDPSDAEFMLQRFARPAGTQPAPPAQAPELTIIGPAPVVSPEIAAKPVVSREAPEAVTQKEPWQMTREEFVEWSAAETGLRPDSPSTSGTGTRRQVWERGHKVLVEKAAREGKIAPPTEEQIRAGEEELARRESGREVEGEESPKFAAMEDFKAVAKEYYTPGLNQQRRRELAERVVQLRQKAVDAGNSNEDISAAQRQSRRPTEPTPQGEQILTPGVAPVTAKEKAEAKGRGALRGGRDPFEGTPLGDVSGRGQGDLVDLARKEPEPEPAKPAEWTAKRVSSVPIEATRAAPERLKHHYSVKAPDGQEINVTVESAKGKPHKEIEHEALMTAQTRYAAEEAAKTKKPKRRKPTKAVSLAAWVKAKGGVRKFRGELYAQGVTPKARPGIINNKTGMYLDDAALEAWEAGYFPDHTERPTVHEFIDALRADVRGESRRYTPEDADLLEQQAWEDQVVEAADRLGIKVSGRSLEDVTDEVNTAWATSEKLPPELEGEREALSGFSTKGYTKRAKEVLASIEKRFFSWYSPLGKLPAKKEFLIQRYRALGRVAKVDEIAKGFNRVFSKASEGDQRAAYKYLTTRGAKPSGIESAAVRSHAVRVKRKIDAVGKALVARGMIPRASYEKYRDEYLPRVYLKHLLGEDMGRIGGNARRLSDQGYTKARKELGEEARAILGEIKDPGYLASRGFALPLRDLAIQDFLQGIASNPKWVFPKGVVPWKGKKVSVLWLDAQAKEIKDRLPYYTDASQKTLAEAVVRRMETVTAPALEAIGKLPEDYRQIPDSTRYGPLRGLPVRKEIYDDLVGAAAWKMDDQTVVGSILGQGGIGTRITQAWKLSKVALNPPTQVRNFLSNGILLHLSGVPLARVPVLWTRAASEMAHSGIHWQIAKRYGVTAASFSANELLRIESELTRIKAKGGPLAQMKHIAGVVANKAGDLYQLSEGLNKVAKIIYEMETNGKSAADAALAAHEAVFDYSLIPPSVRYLRNSPMGMPFVTFYYKAAPRMIEAAVTAPWRFLPYIVMPYALAEIVKGEYDINDDDFKRLMKALPQWLQDQGGVYLLPWKDEHNRWQFVNFGYIMPWSLFTETAGAVKRGDPQQVFSNTGLFGGPIPQATMAMSTNIDPFTKRQIWSPDEPPAMRLEKALSYLWSLGAPTWLTDRGFAGHMNRAMQNKVDRQGRPTLTKTQAALRLFGINIYPVEPGVSRQRNLLRMRAKIRAAKSRGRYDVKNKSLSPEDKADLQRQHKEWIRHLMRKMQEYAKESQLPARLR